MQTVGGLILNVFFTLILIIDTFVIRFNLAYYKNGKAITSRIDIIRNYMSFRFWIDFVSTAVVFTYIVGGDSNLIYLKILFYIKIYSFFIIDQDILDWLDIYPISFGIYRLARVVLLLWFFTTWISCGFFAIDYYFFL